MCDVLAQQQSNDHMIP